MLRPAVLLLLAAATPAFAADPAGTLPDPVPTWSGVYLGATLGAAHSDGQADRGDYAGALIEFDVSNGLFPGSIDDGDTGVIGGVTAGFNFQRGSFVGGIEADFSGLDVDAEAGFAKIDPAPNPPFAGVNTITAYETSFDTLATLRLRAGWSWDDTLLYATGGLAVGRVENRLSLALPQLGYSSPDWSDSGTKVGYAVGGGVEQKLTPRVSLKVEALYFDLDDTTIEGTDPAVFPGQSLSYKFDNDGVVGRIGLNYSF